MSEQQPTLTIASKVPVEAIERARRNMPADVSTSVLVRTAMELLGGASLPDAIAAATAVQHGGWRGGPRRVA
jgi:hypothetical protein